MVTWWKCKSRGRVELKLRLSQERDKKAEETHSKREIETLGEAEKEKRDCRSGVSGSVTEDSGTAALLLPQLCRDVPCCAVAILFE